LYKINIYTLSYHTRYNYYTFIRYYINWIRKRRRRSSFYL